MLGIGGKFASSKGMVAMPDLSNLLRSAAISAIQSAGLSLGNAVASTTSNSSQNDRIFEQSVPAGQLVDYETPVSISYFNYVAPPVPQGPTPINTSSTGCVETERFVIYTTCDPGSKIGSIVYGFRRQNTTTTFFSDGTTSSSTVNCTDSSRVESQQTYNCDGSLDCNSYIRTYSDTRPAGQCSTGFARFSIGVFNAGCGKSDAVVFQFCTSNPNAVDCNSCVSSYTYRTSDSSCASGTAWRSVCTHPGGCSPSQTDVKGGCDPVVAAPVCRTSCTPWYTSSCNQTTRQRFVTRRCSDCNGNNEYRETYFESC